MPPATRIGTGTGTGTVGRDQWRVEGNVNRSEDEDKVVMGKLPNIKGIDGTPR